MEEPQDVVPCSSLAVDSILRFGTVIPNVTELLQIRSFTVPNTSKLTISSYGFTQAGAIWGLCSGPYDARKLGQIATPIELNNH